MKTSTRGQTFTEVLVASSILGIVVLLMANSYSNFTKADGKIRDSLVAASLNDGFGQLSSDPYLVKEMFIDQARNPSFEDCLIEGTGCPKDWKELHIDREAQWIYSSGGHGFDYRSSDSELIEIRMKNPGSRPALVWISRYDYLNLAAQLKTLRCPLGKVINGIDFASSQPLCTRPSHRSLERVSDVP